MSKKTENRVIPWSNEEVILLKLNYACKGAKTWREISQNMQEYTGIIRTTPSLIVRIQKLKDDNEPLTIKDIVKLYNDVVFDVNHTYTKKFTDYVVEHFSNQLSTTEKEIVETLNIEPESQIEKNRVVFFSVSWSSMSGMRLIAMMKIDMLMKMNIQQNGILV